MIDLNETVTVCYADHNGRDRKMTVHLWSDMSEMSEHDTIPLDVALGMLDIRTRRLAEALNHDPGDISEFMRERFGR